MKLPSIKKLPIIPVLVAIFLATGLLLFVNAYSKRGAFSQLNSSEGREILIESQNIDSDNDGLKNWEEELYKTDYMNPDTDGDGYLDGEEINSGHNPLVKAPGDEQVIFPLPVGDKYNLTQKMFSDIDVVLKSYITQKNQYINDHPEIQSTEDFMAQASPETLQEMLNRAILYNQEDWLGKAEIILAEMPEVFNIEISDNDINVSEDNSLDAIKIYANNLLAYLNSETFFFQEKNLLSIKDALSNNNLSLLDKVINDNNAEIEKLRTTEVPPSWKEVHKKTLKIAVTLRNIFVSLRGYESDPIKAMIAGNEFENVLSDWEKLTKEIADLNKSQNLNLSI